MQHEIMRMKDSHFREILELRRLVAVAEKRVAPDVGLDEMIDEFDADAWHCAIKKDGRVVGAGRFIFPDRDARRSEIAKYTPLPNWLFDGKFFEASRFVVHPDHRGGAVYTQLMRETFNLATETGTDYVIADCRRFLLKVYCRLGAVDMKAAFAHPFYPAEQMHLIHFDLKRTYASAPGNFFYWSKVMRPAFIEQARSGRLRLSLVVRLKSLIGRFVPEMRGMEGLLKIRFKLTDAAARPVDQLAA